MSVKRAGKNRTETCAWCSNKTKWQVVGGFGVIKSACDGHKDELIAFDEKRKMEFRLSEEAYNFNSFGREPSIAEMDLGIY